MLKILIADDHALLRVGLKQVLLSGLGNATFGEASNAAETLSQIQREDWNVLILDISLPGRSGLDALRDIQLTRPKLPVLILSASSETQFGLRVLKAGARGFLHKECAPTELVGAVKKVVSGGKYISPALAEHLASTLGESSPANPHEALSEREYEVLCLIGRGRTVSQIAGALALSVKTISTYRVRILAKLGLTASAEAACYAIKKGLVD